MYLHEAVSSFQNEGLYNLCLSENSIVKVVSSFQNEGLYNLRKNQDHYREVVSSFQNEGLYNDLEKANELVTLCLPSKMKVFTTHTPNLLDQQ